MIVVVDASTFISAALKQDSNPERALVLAIHPGSTRFLSLAVEDEYVEILFRAKLDRYVSRDRRRRILGVTLVAARRVETRDRVRECADPKDDT